MAKVRVRKRRSTGLMSRLRNPTDTAWPEMAAAMLLDCPEARSAMANTVPAGRLTRYSKTNLKQSVDTLGT